MWPNNKAFILKCKMRVSPVVIILIIAAVLVFKAVFLMLIGVIHPSNVSLCFSLIIQLVQNSVSAPVHKTRILQCNTVPHQRVLSMYINMYINM